MPFPPLQPVNLTGEITGAVNQFLGASVPPSSSGDGTRWKRVPNNRAGYPVRNLIKWMVPEIGLVEMYINPENIVYSQSKIISPNRTKGGFVLQYWGEELQSLQISGTTGSSGIEGINVLEDVYRSEQVSFDPYALAFAAYLDRNQGRQTILGDVGGNILDVLGTGIGGTLIDQVNNALESGTTNPARLRPTLASLAFTIEMYYSGCIYRGFFKDFSVTESAQKLGLFDYRMTFMVTQKRGYRGNFLGHHRSATSGPSNSDPVFGVPYSYGPEITPQIAQSGRISEERIISLNDRLLTSNGYIGDIGNKI